MHPASGEPVTKLKPTPKGAGDVELLVMVKLSTGMEIFRPASAARFGLELSRLHRVWVI